MSVVYSNGFKLTSGNYFFFPYSPAVPHLNIRKQIFLENNNNFKCKEMLFLNVSAKVLVPLAAFFTYLVKSRAYLLISRKNDLFLDYFLQ